MAQHMKKDTHKKQQPPPPRHPKMGRQPRPEDTTMGPGAEKHMKKDDLRDP